MHSITDCENISQHCRANVAERENFKLFRKVEINTIKIVYFRSNQQRDERPIRFPQNKFQRQTIVKIKIEIKLKSKGVVGLRLLFKRNRDTLPFTTFMLSESPKKFCWHFRNI